MEAETAGLAAYRDRFRRWLVEVDAEAIFARADARSDLSTLRRWQRALYDGGWIGVHWPVELGGHGLSSLHQSAVWEEIASARFPQPPGLIGLEVVGSSIARYGSPEQRERWIARLLGGDDLWCQGFSEPEAGSDLASLRTTARLEGDSFIVSGQKIWSSGAHFADWCAALVRTDAPESRHRGVSYLAIELSSPGVTVRPTEQLTGQSEFSEVFFDDVVVPRENLIGEVNAGWKVALDSLANERGSYNLRRRVELELLFTDIVTHLRAARAEGAVVDEAELGWCRVLLDALAGQTRKTGRRMTDEPGVPSPMDSVDKLLLTRVEQTVLSLAQDTLGFGRAPGTGVESVAIASHWQAEYLFGRAASIYSGTRQIQQSIVAERVFGLPRSR
jgi:alkylation response protein AidB-like acyl-CoA dehydrogenase